MTASRIDLQLGVFGALHNAESVISLLNGANRALNQHSRDGFNDAMADAETITWALLRSIQKTKDDNWNARCSEIDRPAPVREKEGVV